jgi:hypothetical protein
VKQRLPPADLSRIRTVPLERSERRISLEALARPVRAGAGLARFLDGLSDQLGARALRGLARAIVEARRRSSPVVWACGGHVIKVGLSPVLIDLMERGWLAALVLNGAAAIHDWELAAVGATSEDVERGLASGRFGAADETGRALNAAACEAAGAGEGFGSALGRRMAQGDLPHRSVSLLAASHRLGLPATIHVAIGCDVVHLHPAADGAAIGAATFTDFRRVVELVGGLSGGVWVNCGSAVQLPELFLKALSAARNLGHRVDEFTTANLDMLRHYRTDVNVLQRPTRDGAGRSFNLIGHHEINVPLLAAAIEVAAGAGDLD